MKVTITQKQADAIKDFRKCYATTADIIVQVLKVDQDTSTGEILRDFAADNFDNFLNALVNGYTIKQTPQERIKEVYRKESPTHPEGHPGYYKQLEICQAFQEGITFTLNTLNIKIEGVNAE